MAYRRHCPNLVVMLASQDHGTGFYVPDSSCIVCRSGENTVLVNDRHGINPVIVAGLELLRTAAKVPDPQSLVPRTSQHAVLAPNLQQT